MTNKPQRECACGGKLNGEPDETHSLSVCGANPRPCVCGHVESGHNSKGCKHCLCKRFDKSKPQREEVKEDGYENEPCYQRECSNPSKHTNGLHIGSEWEDTKKDGKVRTCEDAGCDCVVREKILVKNGGVKVESGASGNFLVGFVESEEGMSVSLGSFTSQNLLDLKQCIEELFREGEPPKEPEKKPSERIEEIFDSNEELTLVGALIQYLDEQFSKGK